jgi:hypothetical protein
VNGIAVNAAQNPVTDPKDSDDMQDIGNGNYRRHAAYTE